MAGEGLHHSRSCDDSSFSRRLIDGDAEENAVASGTEVAGNGFHHSLIRVNLILWLESALRRLVSSLQGSYVLDH